jgi:hypothetical protein
MPHAFVQAKEKELAARSSWGGVFVYCAFAFPFFLFAVLSIRDFMFILVSGFFAAWGVVYIVMVARYSMSAAKFGDVDLMLEDASPRIGGQLRAFIYVPPAARSATVLHAALECSRVTITTDEKTQQHGKARELIWGKKLAVPVRGLKANFVFDLPAELPSSADDGEWELQVSADLPGLDFGRSYEILVSRPLSGERIEKKVVAEVAPKLVMPVIPEPELVPLDEVKPVSAGAIALLVVVNLLPIAGVAIWGWSVGDVVFLYWIENLIIGAFNLARIAAAVPESVNKLGESGYDPGAGRLWAAKAALGAFFVVHYGAFCWGHGEFLTAFFPGPDGRDPSLFDVVRGMLGDSLGFCAVLAIVASHAYSFFANFIGRGEYRNADFAELMFRPYKRIMVTHIFIIFGGFVIMALRSPAVAMILFVGLKVGCDIYFHRREHSALSRARKARQKLVG